MAISDINTLMEQAKCFRCLSHKELIAVQTYIIAYASGQGMDPDTLMEQARCLFCLSQKQLFQIRAYLIAHIGELSTDPQVLADVAQCYRCIPDGHMESVRAYLLSLDPNGPGTSDPETLEASASSFNGLTPEQSLAIQVYLLATNAGLSTDPSTLQDLAKCFDCLSFDVLNSVTTEVLDEVEHDGGIGGGGGTTCTDVPAQLIAVLENEVYVGDVLSQFDIRLPTVCCNPSRVEIYEAHNPDGTDAVAWANVTVGAAHAGETNYTITLPVVLPFSRSYIIARQVCSDSGAAGWSNVIWVGDPVAGAAAAATWSALVVANGGAAPSADTEFVAGRFYSELLAWGLVSKFKCANFIAPDNEIASRTPIIQGVGAALWLRGNNVGAGFGVYDLNRAGCRGDGTSYLIPNINPNTHLATGSAGVSMYVSSVNQGDIVDWGCRVGANMFFGYANYAAVAYMNCWTTQTSGAVPSLREQGFFSWNRTAANLATIYGANPQWGFQTLGSSALSGGSPPNTGNFAFMCYWDGAVWQGGSAARRYSFAAVHDGLTATESEHLYHAVRVCRVGFGSGYQENMSNPDGFENLIDNFSAEIVRNGGTALTASEEAAFNDFWDSLVAANIHTKMISVNAFLSGSLDRAMTPLIRGPGSPEWDAVNFVAADLTVDGLKGNGTTKYVDPYIFALHYQSVDNAGISMYHLGPAVGNQCEWGAFNSGTQVCALYLDYGPTLCIADFWDYNTGGGSGGRIVGTIADFEGFVSSNRTAANAFSLYNANPNKAWGSLGSVILNTGTRPNVRTFIFAYNNAGAAAAYSEKRISFVAYHDGLTSGEGDALYDAVQNLRVALLGGFVPDVLSTGQVVVAFQNQVVSNGGAAISAGTRAAAFDFWDALVTAGIEDKIVSVNLFVPDNLTAACTPMYRKAGLHLWTNTNFIAGDLTINGLRGDGASKRLDSGIVPSRLVFGAFDFGFAMYVYTGSNSTYLETGVANGGGINFYGLGLYNADANFYSGANGPDTCTAAVGANETGFFSGSRVANNDAKLYSYEAGGSFGQIASNANISTDKRSTLTWGIPAFAITVAGAFFNYSAKRLSCLVVHNGLNSTETEDLRDAIQAFRVALGGGYV